jgi:hypothetical protein
MKQVFNSGLFVGKEEYGDNHMKYTITMLLFEDRKDSQNLYGRVHLHMRKKGRSISGKMKQKQRKKLV